MREDFRSCRAWKLILDQEDLDFMCQAGTKDGDTCLQKGSWVSHPILLLWS